MKKIDSRSCWDRNRGFRFCSNLVKIHTPFRFEKCTLTERSYKSLPSTTTMLFSTYVSRFLSNQTENKHKLALWSTYEIIRNNKYLWDITLEDWIVVWVWLCFWWSKMEINDLCFKLFFFLFVYFFSSFLLPFLHFLFCFFFLVLNFFGAVWKGWWC